MPRNLFFLAVLFSPLTVFAQNLPETGRTADPSENAATGADDLALVQSSTDDFPASGETDTEPAPLIIPGDLASDQLIEESQKMLLAQRHPDALALARMGIERAGDPENPFGPALIRPIANLASIQALTGNEAEALGNYRRATDLIERDGGIFDARLVEVINGWGRTLQNAGNHDEAINLFFRSQHISHRDDGVYSPDQAAALELMTVSHLAGRDLDSANKAQELLNNVDIHRYGRNSVLAVPSMVRLARFKASVRMLDDAKNLYFAAIHVTENSLGENDIALIDLLLGVASVRQFEQQVREVRQRRMNEAATLSATGFYDPRIDPAFVSRQTANRQIGPDRVQGATTNQALEALMRALRIVDMHEDTVTAAERMRVHIRLGDLYLKIGKTNLGIETYQKALEIIEAETNSLELADLFFGRPKRLRYIKPRPRINAAGRYTKYDGTFAEASFVVMSNGHVDNVEVTQSTAPASMLTQFRKEVRRSIYRPRFIDGKPVATPELFREEFSDTVSPVN